MTQPSAPSQPQSEPKTADPVDDIGRPIGALGRVAAALDKWSPNIEKLTVGTKLTMARFRAVAMSAFARTPKLLECTPFSIRQSFMAAAELGLEIGGVTGEAYLVPYNTKKRVPNGQGGEIEVWVTEAQCIVGYKGYLRLAHESGLFRQIDADVILPDDAWEPIRRGPDGLTWGHVQGEPKGKPQMMKIPAEKWGAQRGEKVRYEAEIPALRGAYAYARPKDREADDIVRPIWLARLEEIRQRTKSGFDGPWITDYHEMARKTAVRNLWKYLPKNDRMKRVDELDDDGLDDTPSGGPALPPAGSTTSGAPPASTAEAAQRKTQSAAERAKARLDAQKQQRPAEPPPAPASEPEVDRRERDESPDDAAERYVAMAEGR